MVISPIWLLICSVGVITGRPSEPIVKNKPIKPSGGKLFPFPVLSTTKLYKSTIYMYIFVHVVPSLTGFV